MVPDQLKNNYHRIVGGTEADINEFPWTVGLYTHYRCKGLPVCGGSLISTQHVLTAAHCIQRNIFLTYIRLPYGNTGCGVFKRWVQI